MSGDNSNDPLSGELLHTEIGDVIVGNGKIPGSEENPRGRSRNAEALRLITY